MRRNPGLRLTRRTLALLLALAMTLTCFAVTAVADGEEADPNVHVLEASALTPFDAGAKADGDTETVGDYFTVIYSAKSKVDGSKKTWDDGYTSEQRINFGGKATTEKNAVKFTTSNPATVKIWWAQGGDDNREYAILNSAGEVVVKTSGTYEKNGAYMSTLELAEAGTYFLGGETNNNYLFKVEVEETPAATEKVSVLEANTLEAFDAGAKADGETETVGDYFTVIYSAKSKVDGSKKSWEDGYASEQRINFGGKATTEKNAVKFTTSGPATVKIWWAQGGDDNREYAILNSAGEVVVKTSGTYEKNGAYMSTLELAEAGTYFLGGETNNNYLFKVEVTESAGEKPARADWAGVAAPEITDVAVDGEKPGNVNVTVKGQVGYDSADSITVTMYDADGWAVKSLSSLAEKDEHVLTFTPDKSGTYSFGVTAGRDGETEVHRGAETKTLEFVYPLGVPVLKYAANDGKGGLVVEWNSVKEATGYTVTAGDRSVTTEGLNNTKVTVLGLTVGDEVEVSVAAIRDEEAGKACEAKKVTVSDEAETAWVFAAFGTSTNTKDNGFEELEDGSVRVFSTGGRGKVQPSAEDGLAFYYTALDAATTNFVLTATANVNTWTFSNGQEGFGLIVMDQVGVHGSTAPVWSNSFMAGVSGFNYTTPAGARLNMRIGVGALQRSGVTEYTETSPAGYAGTWTALDPSTDGLEAGTYNVVGNCATPEKVNTVGEGRTSFTLRIEKNDEGYFVSYIDDEGVTHTAEYRDPRALSYVDPYIYVGMFAARNVDVTFTDITLTTSAATAVTPDEGDEEEETLDAVFGFHQPEVSNRENIELDLRANAGGKVVVSDASGEEVYSGQIKAGERLLVPVELKEGENGFTAVLTPDKDFVTAEGVKLTSYEAVEAETAVTLETDERTEIYVSPNGKADAKGTKDDPTTLAEAVKCPAPGTKIILLEGTYKLTSGVTVARGIDGTEDAPIVPLPIRRPRPARSSTGARRATALSSPPATGTSTGSTPPTPPARAST